MMIMVVIPSENLISRGKLSLKPSFCTQMGVLQSYPVQPDDNDDDDSNGSDDDDDDDVTSL
jgi:hypothetical protein